MSTKKKATKPHAALPPLKAYDQPPKPPTDPQPVKVWTEMDDYFKLLKDLATVLSEDASAVFTLAQPDKLSPAASSVRNRLAYYRDQIRWFRSQK